MRYFLAAFVAATCWAQAIPQVNPISLPVANDGSTGTSANALAYVNSASHAIIASTSTTAKPIYCVVAGAGTSGQAFLATSGLVTNCLADAAGVTAGDYLGASTATAGRIMDLGSSIPSNSCWAGFAQATSGANAAVAMIMSPGCSGAGSASVPQYTSVGYSSSLSLTATSNSLSKWIVGTLTGNLSISITGLTAGQIAAFEFVQDGTGGRTVTVTSPSGWPTVYINPGAGTTTDLMFSIGSSGVAHVLNGSSLGLGVETAAPSYNPASGTQFPLFDSTSHHPRWKNSSGTYYAGSLEGTGLRVGAGANTDDTFITPGAGVATALAIAKDTTGGFCTAGGAGCGASPGTAWNTYGYQSGSLTATANATTCTGVIIPSAGLSVGHVVLSFTATDSSNGDFGIYNSSGTLVAHTGAHAFTTSSYVSTAFAGGTQSVPGGPAYFCFTSVAGTVAVAGYQNDFTFYGTGVVSGATTSGGVLLSSITPPSNSYAFAEIPAVILLP